MQHLNEETIARLADGHAHPGEAEHLAVCEYCRRQLEMFRADLRALRSLPRLVPPETEWNQVSRRLSARRSWRRPVFALAAVAAAGVVFVMGMITGRRGAVPPTFAMDSSASAGAMTARLAAFEAALLTTREAARRAPGDAVLLSYEHMTMTARERALRAVQLTSNKQWY